MSEHSELLAEAGLEWEREVRGYNRQQVDNYVAWRAGQVRELESRLSQSIAEIEHLRHELADVRASARRPPHEEISERVGQILKLAAEEAKAEREHGAVDANELREAAKKETDKLRADVKQEVDGLKAEAQDRAERMLTAAQEQADRAVATATAEADKMLSSAHAAAEQTVSEANQHAESTVGAAMAQAKQQLDDATARATAPAWSRARRHAVHLRTRSTGRSASSRRPTARRLPTDAQAGRTRHRQARIAPRARRAPLTQGRRPPSPSRATTRPSRCLLSAQPRLAVRLRRLRRGPRHRPPRGIATRPIRWPYPVSAAMRPGIRPTRARPASM